jgi:ribonuclease BN (tRNA processing enzyme)
MEITFLGTAGWMPSDQRETASIAVRLGSSLILLDAGTGVRRLVTDPALHGGVESIHVLLSHFHLDHVVGLSYLSALPEEIPVEICGPGDWLYDSATEQILGELIRPPLQPKQLADLPVTFRELSSEGIEIAGTSVVTRKQERHSAPSVGLRLGDALVYASDTAYDEGTVQFAAGAEVLLHEAFAHSDEDAVHSSARGAARIATAAGCQQLHLVHLAPTADPAVLGEHARSEFALAQVARDLQTMAIADGA